MRAAHRPILAAILLLVPASAMAGEPIRLATTPALSPDGSLLAFAYKGDIWVVPSIGGEARRLTEHFGRDREPKFSPDGKEIAFTSDREGSAQVYVMPGVGGVPRQVTHHTAGHSLQGWFPDGKSLLVSAGRDHYWRGTDRFFKVKKDERVAEEILFDDYGKDGSLSPDGSKLLFVREGAPWWRRGYKGSQSGQIWSYDAGSKSFAKLLSPDGGALWPLWKPDGKGFYYVGAGKDGYCLRERDFEAQSDRALTDFPSDSVVTPCLSRDGSTLVFRHLFDFYRIEPAKNSSPVKIEITAGGDATTSPIERRTVTEANDVAFSKDGLEIAFTAGGDVWVMDTELMEPRRVTDSPEEERSPVFSPDGESLLFVSDRGGQADLWRAKRGDAKSFWWQNSDFPREKLTDDADVETEPTYSPDGSKVAFLKSRGDLWVMNADGKESRKVVPSWSSPNFDWSPDGKWITYSTEDDDFNRDIWVMPIDGSIPPYNLSRHPDNEDNPRWSPDGKVIAFTGRRQDTEVDIYFVYLREEDDQADRRDRIIDKALEKMTKGRKQGIFTPGSGGGGGAPAGGGRRGARPAAGAAPEPPKPDTPKADDAKPEEPKPAEPKAPTPPPKVVIDFERVHERIRRIAIPDATETGLFWAPDSKKLGFVATIEGKRGTYTVEMPDDLKPKLLSAQAILQPRWVEAGNQILGLVGPPVVAATEGIDADEPGGELSPASITAAGKETTFRVRAPQEIDLAKHHRAGFDMAWRTMRDRFYDERLGNRDWEAVRRKYADMAEQAADTEAFATVVQLMLGELNGSHLGFSPGPAGLATYGGRGRPGAEPAAGWTVTTAHLGLRFVADDKGPGLLVRDVIPDGPTDHKKTRVVAGERLIKVDGTEVSPGMDLTMVLNGPLDRDIKLTIRSIDGKDRDTSIRPISFTAATALLYDKWVKENRRAVETASKGTLGYLHIRGMSMPSFYKFEEDLYAAGAGKEGLIVDVRENGGGSTTDLLLTCLTQPVHAITVPRGGGPGYPQDRKIFASWSKPIVVLCNQNSFSNAEIFSHAIKTLKRGHLVGTPTAGGVISTGATGIMDLGTLRLPNRGWFLLNTGEDMELNGAVPDVVVWPMPGDMPKGKDDQLAKAVDVLSADVAEWKAQPRPKLRKATER